MLIQQTAPTDTLVTLQQLKDHLRIDDNDSDARLTLLLAASRDMVEHDTDQTYTSQTWLETLFSFPQIYRAGKNPVQSLSVSYYDGDNQQQELDPDTYYQCTTKYQTKLVPVDVWPTTFNRPDAVQVTLTCGVDDVPPMACQACLLLCGTWNEFAESENFVVTSEIKVGYDRLIRNLRGNLLC